MPPAEPLTEQELKDGGRLTVIEKHMTALDRIVAFLHYHIVLWRAPKVDDVSEAISYLQTIERGAVRIRHEGRWYGGHATIERIDE